MAPMMQADLREHLHPVASGKVRELYELDELSLLFVATDRISGGFLDLPDIWNPTDTKVAFDFVMSNVRLRINALCRYCFDRSPD